MVHSPAFDYNILLLENISSCILDRFGDILSWHETTYESPAYLSAKYHFDVDKSYYTVKIVWVAATDREMMYIDENVWNLTIIKNSSIVQHYPNVSIGYILNTLRRLFCPEENQ